MIAARQVSRVVRRACLALLDLAFPPKCRACGGFYPPPRGEADPKAASAPPPQAFSALMAPFLCPACRDGFARVDGPICTLCGRRIREPDGGEPVCGACRGRTRHLRRARSFGSYEGSLKTALHQLKYQARVELATPLGRLLFETFRQHWPGRDLDIILPVPLHPRKFRRRGFNQAYLLIRGWPALAAEKGLDLPDGILQRSALRRVRETDAQVGMNRRTRQANIRNAFTLGPGVSVSGKRILLVDDVYTTGATAEECAGALRRAGAEWVDLLTLAQTVRNL